MTGRKAAIDPDSRRFRQPGLGLVHVTGFCGGSRPQSRWRYVTSDTSRLPHCTRSSPRQLLQQEEAKLNLGLSQLLIDSPATEAAQETDIERRLRESQRVDERITPVYNVEDFRRELDEAGHMLVVLEVESPTVCQTGFDEEPEIQYKTDREAALAPCQVIKHVFQRTARDSPDVKFLAMEADTEEGQQACEELGIEVIPTVQFWRDGQKLWEHKGIVELESDLGEGVLYYGDTAANNVRASDFVEEVSSRPELERWLAKQGEKELSVLNVSLMGATPCVHIFPAVLALAKNMAGYASFARLLADANDEARALAQEFNVVQVPTFIFFRKGKEVGRHVGSTRGDLIGQILQQQSALGIMPPPAAPVGVKPKKVKHAAW